MPRGSTTSRRRRFAILVCLLARGFCDYFGNYLISWVGINTVTDIRQKVFDKLLRHDAQFFESHSTGRIMSSVMSDIEKIQMATSSMLADWLRQIFSAAALLYIVFNGLEACRRQSDRASDRRCSYNPYRSAHSAHHPSGSGQCRGTERDPSETIVGQQVVKAFGSEKHESRRFHAAAWKLRNANFRYVAQQAIASPLIEFFGAVTIVALSPTPVHKSGRQSHNGRIHQFRHCALMFTNR